VLERRVSFQLAEGFTYLCCQEDRLIITCIHTLYRHGRIRLSDLGIAYESLKAGLDVRKILETVESAGVSRGFAVSLHSRSHFQRDDWGRPNSFSHQELCE